MKIPPTTGDDSPLAPPLPFLPFPPPANQNVYISSACAEGTAIVTSLTNFIQLFPKLLKVFLGTSRRWGIKLRRDQWDIKQH